MRGASAAGWWLGCFLIGISSIGPGENVVRADEPGATDFAPLFDGKTLDGWRNPYEWGEAWVEDGEIRLRGDRKFFLVTDRVFGDFVFEGEVRVPDGPANSGFMFRCEVGKNLVRGYQAEVDPSERRWSGGLYDEGRRGWLNPLSGDEPGVAEARGAFDRSKWNAYRVECVGDRIKIHVNGILTTDYRDPVDAIGPIGIQHHGEKGQIYRFRNLRIKELGRSEWRPLFDGKSTAGWTGFPEGAWTVEGGRLIGGALKGDQPGLLIADGTFGDFVARVRFKTVEGRAAARFRTRELGDPKGLGGYSAAIGPAESAGSLFEPGARGSIAAPGPEVAAKLLRPGASNELTVSANDGWIVVHVNGTKTAEVRDDPGSRAGKLALEIGGNARIAIEAVEILQPVAGK